MRRFFKLFGQLFRNNHWQIEIISCESLCNCRAASFLYPAYNIPTGQLAAKCTENLSPQSTMIHPVWVPCYRKKYA